MASVMAEEAEYYKSMLTAEQIQKLIDQTLADSNIQKAKPFVTPEGKLGFLCGIYTPAGAGLYYQMWDADGNNFTVKCEEHAKK